MSIEIEALIAQLAVVRNALKNKRQQTCREKHKLQEKRRLHDAKVRMTAKTRTEAKKIENPIPIVSDRAKRQAEIRAELKQSAEIRAQFVRSDEREAKSMLKTEIKLKTYVESGLDILEAKLRVSEAEAEFLHLQIYKRRRELARIDKRIKEWTQEIESINVHRNNGKHVEPASLDA